MFHRILVVATVLALLGAALTAGPALAGKTGNGRSGGATLSVYQNGVQVSSVAPGSPIEVRGSGFRANTTVYVGLQGFFGMDQVTTDGAGKFILPKVAPSTPSTYSYVALVYSHKTWVIAACSEYFQVS